MRSIGYLFLCMCCIGGTSNSAFAIAIHEPSVTPDSAYLEYANMFPSVGWMFGIENGQDVLFSSGVLIDEHWVLTAAHSVLEDDNDNTSSVETYEFGLGSNFRTDPGESLFSTEVFVNPGYNGFENGPDLALLYFEDAFTSVEPALLYTGPVEDLTGTNSSLVGYGGAGTPSTGLQPIDANRRAGTNTLTFNIDDDDVFQRARFIQPGLTNWQQLGALGTPGDSGGGWFIEDDGDFYLTGISSFWTGILRYCHRAPKHNTVQFVLN